MKNNFILNHNRNIEGKKIRNVIFFTKIFLLQIFSFYSRTFSTKPLLFIFQNHDQTAHPVTEQLSICEDQDSFRPLIGQPGDQSSYLLTEQRDTGMEPLVGQPSAHSSMIGQPSDPPLSAGWDSESHHGISLSHITEQESSQRRHRDERDPCAGQLTSRTEPSLLDEHPEESSMRPLVAELDVSSGQDSGSSGLRILEALCGQ